MFGIPAELLEVVTAHLRASGETHPVRQAEAARGGYSSAAKSRLVTRRSSYLLKWQVEHRPRLFTSELRDLGNPDFHDATPRIEAALRWYLGPG